MATTAASDAGEGPVLSLINKRIRALRKKQNRIVQIEEAISQGKAINKEQEEVLRSKSSIIPAIDELEKLRQPLSVAVAEEVNIAVQRINETSESTIADESNGSDGCVVHPVDNEHGVIEDLLNLIYLGSLFDVKSQNDYAWTMFRRAHERGSCLTYDYVTDDDTADMMLGERDLDLISMVGGLIISRPVDSTLNHKEALQRCVEHAKLWIAKSDQPIGADASFTYAALRERLNKIIGSDYFVTRPEIKAPVEYASVAANFASFQIPVDVHVPAQVQGSVAVEQLQDEDSSQLKGNETHENKSSPDEEHHGQAESGSQNRAQDSIQTEEHGEELENMESKDQQHNNNNTNNNNTRPFNNQRGGRGGRRNFSNGRVGGRFGGGRGGGGAYQNGRNHYYDQQQQGGNYYQRNYRGRGGDRGDNGGNSYHDSTDRAGNAQSES